MAAVFLATLYEYSPLFYISVVSLCFVVTAALVLGFGFDVPVILRSYDEPEPSVPTPEKQMVQVTNPFTLELGCGPASVTGVLVRPCCLEPCVLSCFWGCEVSTLQGALHAHQHGMMLSTHQHFQEVLNLHYHYCQKFISSEDAEERHTQIPADQSITDFGLLPRQRYPLVAVLTLEEAQTRNWNHIVASVTVIHVPDDKYKLSARVLFQYVLTSQGSMYELKPLFMSADSTGMSGSSDSACTSPPSETPNKGSVEDQGPVMVEEEEEEEEEEGWSERTQGRDCVVCQNASVNRVLLPCRHTCMCDSCVSYFQHCPICRAFVMESF
uniref:Cell growth regulator with RING finger domain protein 1 n=1 Tax=Amphilophus citrinellus TaxID=61819 RepID=A0A3Q0SS61_AMPCI